MAALDQATDIVDVERDLGDQDDVGAASDPGMQRDPAGVTSHDLDHEDPVVALGGGVEPVDRLTGHVQRGVEPECDVGGAEVIVDRLRHADHVHAFCVQPVSSPERVLAPDRDQAIEAISPERGADLLDAFLALERIRPRAPEDRASARQDAARGLDRQRLEGVLEHALPAVAKANKLIVVGVDPLAHDRRESPRSSRDNRHHQ